MEMQQIRYFLAAAVELNFTRAAARCNVSQPSLTRAIGLLEGELGGDLFRRERNLTHLTDLGRRLLPLLTQTIENADRAALVARSIRTNKLVSLCLALPDGVPLEPFVPHLLELAKVFSEFDFKIRRGVYADLAQKLREGEIDLLLGPKPDDAWERYAYWPLYPNRFSLVFRSDHPISQREVIRATDLNGTCVLHRPYCGISAEMRAHLAEAGVTLKPALEFARDDDLIAYLSSSQSVAFLPNAAYLRDALTRRRLDGPEAGYEVYAITVSGRPRGAALNLFLTQLRAADWQAVAA
jgi:DNA-binding transcriptional LysR family regulator